MDKLNELKELIIKHVEELEEDKVLEKSSEALNAGLDPLSLMEIINEGMNRVGKLYEKKDYYIADLIMAGIIFKEVLELDKMKAYFQGSPNAKKGKIILGTVEGDIHDIGKNIFKSMLEAKGFKVIDLGVDVPKEAFVEVAMENKPCIIGLSGALTNTIDSMKEVVDAITKAGLREEIKIIIGANHITTDICKYIGADGFANDASIGTKICLEWMKDNNKQGVVEDEKSSVH